MSFKPLTAKERFTALQSGEVDVLSRTTTWTMSRDSAMGLSFVGIMYVDGQGLMVPSKLGVKSAKELNGASVCVATGTTTELNLADYFRTTNMTYKPVVFEKVDEVNAAYDAGRCDVYTTDQSSLYAQRLRLRNPDDHVVLPEIISKEPLGPSVRQGDFQWFTLNKWVYYALLNAEELGVTSKNVDEMLKSTNPDIRRLLGTEGEFGKAHRPRQRLGREDRQGRRQLRRDLRAQRGAEHAAQDRPRPEQPLEQGRHPVRPADPVAEQASRRRSHTAAGASHIRGSGPEPPRAGGAERCAIRG